MSKKLSIIEIASGLSCPVFLAIIIIRCVEQKHIRCVEQVHFCETIMTTIFVGKSVMPSTVQLM